MPPLLSDICVSPLLRITSCYHIQQSRDVFPLHCLQGETESQHLIWIIWWREREELKGGTQLQQGRILNAIMQSALASLGCTSFSGLVCLKHTHTVLAEKQKQMLISQGPYPEVVEIYENDVALKT